MSIETHTPASTAGPVTGPAADPGGQSGAGAPAAAATSASTGTEGAKPEAKGETDWKAEARKWEDRAKQNQADQDELQKLRTERMTESEKAIEQARNEAREAGRAEASLELGAALVQAEFRGLLGGRVTDEKRLAVLVDNLPTGSFLKDGKAVDRDALKTYADAIAPAGPAGAADLGGGYRTPASAPVGAAGAAEAARRFGKTAS